MSDEFLPAGFGTEVAGAFRQVMGSMQDLMEEKFEYRMTDTIDQVNELAREGWLLHSGIGVPGVVRFIMQRKLGAADAAAELLRNASKAAGSLLSTPGDTPHNSQDS